MRAFVAAVVLGSIVGNFGVARAQGRQAQTAVTLKTQVVYGEVQGSALLADLAYPTPAASGPRRPAIMYVHGGRWRSGSRANANSAALFKWAEAGFFTMSIDYRLVTATPAPAAYEDTLCAVRWLHAHADEYGVDPDRIFLIGESSGGHLISLLATLGQGPYAKAGGWDTARSDVKAVISVAGAYDLNTLSWGNLWTPLGDGNVEAARRQASPIRFVSATTRPILVIHSDDDRSVPIEQALDMVKTLEAAKVPHRFVHYADRGHMGLTDEVLREARAFIDEVEKRK
jgi:acetyl esterase/lipase